MSHSQKNWSLITILLLLIATLALSGCSSSSTASKSGGLITPTNGQLEIPVASISDGKAHHFQAKASDGTMVTFFVLKSADGVLRAAIDACDVCYRSGLGYYQAGDIMGWRYCGEKFASNKVNVIKLGCNTATRNTTLSGNPQRIQPEDTKLSARNMN